MNKVAAFEIKVLVLQSFFIPNWLSNQVEVGLGTLVYDLIGLHLVLPMAFVISGSVIRGD